MNGRGKILTHHRRFRVDPILNEEIEHFLFVSGQRFSDVSRKMWLDKIKNIKED